MNEENKPKENFGTEVTKGMSLGVSVAIPGLSAGTIAVAEKCYDTIIDAISGLRKEFRKNFLILLPYLIGLVIGAIIAFIGIQKGYSYAPFSITAAFSGIVIGSLPIALSELRKGKTGKEKAIHVLAFVLSLALAAGLGIFTALYKVDLQQAMLDRVWWIYVLALVSGIVGAFACVVPGISGSMSLMVIGMYFPILNTFATTKGELSIFQNASDTKFLLTGLLILLLLIVGAVIGLALSSKVMKKLLTNHRVSTFYSILGLIIGSVISMYINSSIYPLYIANSIKTWDYILGAVLFVLFAGFILFVTLRKKKAKENN